LQHSSPKITIETVISSKKIQKTKSAVQNKVYVPLLKRNRMKTKITLIKTFSLFIALFCGVNFGFGQIVAWEMDGNLGNEITVDATTLAANLNTSTLIRGSGLNAPAIPAQDAFSSTNFTLNGTQENTLTNDDFLQFQVSAITGYQVSINSLNANFRRSLNGPNEFIWSYSLDGATFIDIETAFLFTNTADTGAAQAPINLSVIPALQNVVSGTAITFRLYGWGATDRRGTFSIGRLTGNDLSLGVTVAVAPPCPTTVTWNGSAWTPSAPTLTTAAVINGDYDTATFGSFSACSLTVNTGFELNINDVNNGGLSNTYVEVENDVVADGGILVNSQANFIQNNDNATFTDNSGGLVVLSKDKTSQRWYSYTYWGSPVENENIEGALGPAPADRRFTFIAANFVDNDTEIGNTNTFTAGTPDGLDDNSNDWVNTPTGPMVPGVGYAATAGEFAPFFPITETFNFFGKFNNGEILVPLVSNSGGAYEDWNLVGNPYPCAINAIDFLTLNSSLIGVIYLWDQSTPPSSTTGGGQNSNFSADDYAMINGSGGIAATSNPLNTPNSFIPSGQGFFVDASSAGNLTFNNSLRAITNNNGQFFKKTKTKSKASNSSANKLWVNLTSDNGVFNQILVSYINGATNANDGDFYDAPRSLSSVNNTSLYSVIENDNSKFAIQAKATSSLNEDEIINLGFKTTITVPTLYKLSVAQLEGAFLTSNTLFLVDTLLNKVHDLSASDYTFTSAVGEFNSRFSIAFTNKALSVNDVLLNTNALKIVDLQDDFVQFNTSSNLTIKSVNIYDLLGRQLYQFKGENTSETYRLAHLNNSVYMAKVTLSNGAVVTKKAVKK
jgi:uncharacterized membrane protein